MATTAGTRIEQEKAWTPTLLRAFELGVGQWQLGLTTGVAPRPRDRSVTAGDVHAVLEEMARAKGRFGLPEEAGGVSGDEAGRDGFWRHRCLVAHGLKHGVVDASSLEVNRRQRRAKTDRLDVHQGLTRLRRHRAGEQKGWSVVRVPRVDDADRRQLHRALVTTQRERTRVINRIKGLLAGYGIHRTRQGEVATPLAHLQPGDGTPLPSALRARLPREWPKVGLLTAQIAAREAERRARLRTSEAPAVEQVRRVNTLRGIGRHRAWLSVMEVFAWRDLRTPQPVGA